MITTNLKWDDNTREVIKSKDDKVLIKKSS